ncbi:site-specific integrase [Pelagibacterium halotolerans]|uniref:site-specific integrase n=1 Tax=Pelagibacterium halotolerans TaxID=531813 RepID=UPI00385125D8
MITIRPIGPTKRKRRAVLDVNLPFAPRSQVLYPSREAAEVARTELAADMAIAAALRGVTFGGACATMLADPEAFSGSGQKLRSTAKALRDDIRETPIAAMTLVYLTELYADLERAHISDRQVKERMRLVIRVIVHACRSRGIEPPVHRLAQLPVRPRKAGYGTRAPQCRTQSTYPDWEDLTDRLTMAKGALSVLLRILILAGLRIGEALALRRSDVDFSRHVLRVRSTIDKKRIRKVPKSPAGIRDVPMSAALERTLRDWLACGCQKPNRQVVSGEDGAVVDYDLARKWHTAFERDHGLVHFTFHSYRHACVSVWIHAGIALRLVRKWIGHADLRTTVNTYATALAVRARERSAGAAFDTLQVRQTPGSDDCPAPGQEGIAGAPSRLLKKALAVGLVWCSLSPKGSEDEACVAGTDGLVSCSAMSTLRHGCGAIIRCAPSGRS